MLRTLNGEARKPPVARDPQVHFNCFRPQWIFYNFPYKLIRFIHWTRSKFSVELNRKLVQRSLNELCIVQLASCNICEVINGKQQKDIQNYWDDFFILYRWAEPKETVKMYTHNVFCRFYNLLIMLNTN